MLKLPSEVAVLMVCVGLLLDKKNHCNAYRNTIIGTRSNSSNSEKASNIANACTKLHVSPYEEHTDTLAFSLLIFNSAIHSKSSLKFFVFLFKAFFPSIVYHRLTRLPRDNVLALIAILLPLFLFLSSFRSTFFICKCSSPPVLCLAEIMRRRARAGRHAALRVHRAAEKWPALIAFRGRGAPALGLLHSASVVALAARLWALESIIQQGRRYLIIIIISVLSLTA